MVFGRNIASTRWYMRWIRRIQTIQARSSWTSKLLASSARATRHSECLLLSLETLHVPDMDQAFSCRRSVPLVVAYMPLPLLGPVKHRDCLVENSEAARINCNLYYLDRRT
jgi:hypothetical protein